MSTRESAVIPMARTPPDAGSTPTGARLLTLTPVTAVVWPTSGVAKRPPHIDRLVTDA